MSTRYILLVCIAVFGGCSQQAAHDTRDTNGDQPEIRIEGVGIDSVNAQLIRQMLYCGFKMSKQSDDLLVFECPSDDFWTNVFLGSQHDSEPGHYYRVAYSVEDRADGVRVVADCAVVEYSDSGLDTLRGINGTKGAEQIQSILDYVGETMPKIIEPTTMTTESATEQLRPAGSSPKQPAVADGTVEADVHADHDKTMVSGHEYIRDLLDEAASVPSGRLMESE